MIPISDARTDRHGFLPDGSPRPYKGYKGDSNYCIEIVRLDDGRWHGEVVSRFDAYRIVRTHGAQRLRDPALAVSGRPLVMRLMRNDSIRLVLSGHECTMRVVTISANGQIFLSALNEANVDKRNRDKADPFSYVSKMAGSLRTARARPITVSPIGDARDPGPID